MQEVSCPGEETVGVDGRVGDMKGTWPVVTPERRCQAANGISESRCHHGLRTVANSCARLVEGRGAVKVKEGFAEDGGFRSG